METARKAEEAGITRASVAPPASSAECVDCHAQANPGIVDHWRGSEHSVKGVGCVECHTDQERLIANAKEEEVGESLSEGEG